jgi:hypothetical protein
MGILRKEAVATKKRLRSCSIKLAYVVLTLLVSSFVFGPTSEADPDPNNPHPPPDTDYPVQPLTAFPDVVRPLPPFTPRPSNWRPSFPYPYNVVGQNNVTELDIKNEREVCQWFNAQFDTLYQQIDIFQYKRIIPNGPGVINGSGSDWDYSAGDLQQQADVLAKNIEQSVGFLAPRVQAFTVDKDYAADDYYPLDGAKSFYLLWQHLSNVSAGIKSHQPDWFTGPSVQRVKRNGSVINRSHICRY